MLLDIQGDMEAIKNTMNELEKLSDEEKINLPKDVYLRNIFCHDCSFKKTCGNDSCESYEFWKEGYEKGLAEGRKEKWHDLRKNPDDLPNEFENVLCYCKQLGMTYYCVGQLIDVDARIWWSSTGSEKLNVVWWCELPKFEEEK